MAIPDYETLMLSVLQSVSDGGVHRIRDVTNSVSDQFNLSKEDRQILLPSGQQTLIANRVGWAKTYLLKAGLLDSPKRGMIKLSSEGEAVLAANPTEITNSFLERYPSFLDFKKKRKPSDKTDTDNGDQTESDDDQTPEETLETAFNDIQLALADELLESVKACTPEFFERLVVELLVSMGYGGSIEDAGKAIGRSGDQGIDGIIKEDKLGLDIVCIQAKRYTENSVGRPQVQAFAGSMEAFRAKKGVLLTTSSFSREAYDFVDRIERKIVLVDGERLAKLMIEHGIGVTTVRTIKIKRIDTDYFDD